MNSSRVEASSHAVITHGRGESTSIERDLAGVANDLAAGSPQAGAGVLAPVICADGSGVPDHFKAVSIASALSWPNCLVNFVQTGLVISRA